MALSLEDLAGAVPPDLRYRFALHAHSAVSCYYFPSGWRLPFQSKSITAPWPVPIVLLGDRGTSVTGRMRHARGLLNSATLSAHTVYPILIKFALLPGHIHVLLYFMYSVFYYSTTCYNPATGC